MNLSLCNGNSPTSYRFEVCSNLPREKEKSYACGAAISVEGEDFYRLALWMIPKDFYLARVRSTTDIRYTIYATKTHDENGAMKFIDPVGWAVPCEFNKEYLELRFKFPRQCLFMCLYPKENS